MRFAAIILGAGASSRMGTPKLLLPWGGATILEHLVRLWELLGARPVALVCAPAPHPVHAAATGSVLKIINASPEAGMFSSIQAAARWPSWPSDLTHFVLVLGDQPQITRRTLEQLIEHARRHPRSICQPYYEGRPKHPLVLPRTQFEQLAASEAATLRDFLAAQSERAFAEMTDPGLACDLDTPEDYKAALARQRDNR